MLDDTNKKPSKNLPKLTTSFLDVCDDAVFTIGSFVPSVEDFKNLSFSCRRTYGLFATQAKTAILLQHILQGKVESAKKLISHNPELLFKQAQGCDYALGYDGKRRVVNCSPFQAILGAGDIPLFE